MRVKTPVRKLSFDKPINKESSVSQFSQKEIEKFLNRYKCYRAPMKSMYLAGNLVYLRRFSRDGIPENTVYRIGMVKQAFQDPMADWGGTYHVEMFERVHGDGNESENVFRPSKLCEKMERILQKDIAGYVIFPVTLPNRGICFEPGTLPDVPIN